MSAPGYCLVCPAPVRSHQVFGKFVVRRLLDDYCPIYMLWLDSMRLCRYLLPIHPVSDFYTAQLLDDMLIRATCLL